MVRALWLLTRPAGTPWVLLLPFIGYGFAHWDFGLHAVAVAGIVTLVAAWWFLHAGTMWLNAALDQDEGEVLYGRPTDVPALARPLGMAALLVSVGLAAQAGAVAGTAATACALLSVLYSDPRTAWKGHPAMGPVVNVLGYGILSPVAGWSLVGVPPTWRGAVLLLCLSSAVLGTYFAMQAFQEPEDRARGYRTLVVTHGPRRTLRTAHALYTVTFAGFALLAVVGWLPRLCLLGALGYLGVRDALKTWLSREQGGSVADAMLLVRRLMAAGAGVVLAAYVHHGWQIVHGWPPAGLGTAGGH